MGSRDRESSKSLQDKLKVFFKKGASAPAAARGDLLLTAELERELGADTPLARRLRALRDVADRALLLRLHEGGVQKLWTCTRDLLEDSNVEARHAALSCLRCIAEGQADYLLIMRTIMFRFLRTTHPTHPPEDSQLRFKLLHTLTNSGKNINCFEEEIGGFLLEWLPQIQTPSFQVEFLQLITNVVKFNAAYLDEEIVHGIVNNACQLAGWSADSEVVGGALSLLEAVVSYSLLPRAALPVFVRALCHTVNVEHYTQPSWKLMVMVMGADLGHAALLELVRAASEADAPPGLVRGAVFYVNMAVWGARRPPLHVSYLAVLPALLRALHARHALVSYEVVAGMASAVSRSHSQLLEPAWDVVVRILHQVLQLHESGSGEQSNELIVSRAHDVITEMEALHDGGQYYGDPEQLLELVDSWGHHRPEASAMRLVSVRAAGISPAGAHWCGAALALGERYVRGEVRPAVRLHALSALGELVQRHMVTHGDELLEAVGLPLLGWCASDPDVSLRAAAAKLLHRLALRHATHAAAHYTDLVDLLEKILNRPFEMYVSDVSIPAEADVADLTEACGALAGVVRARVLAPPAAHAARALLVLLDHLDHHYRRAALFTHHPSIRIKIFELLFSLRVNSQNCIGVEEAGRRTLYSPFLLVEASVVRGQPAAAAREVSGNSCVVPAGRLARALVAALTHETDWAVLGGVVRALPAQLRARGPLAGRRAPDLDLLAATLCAMVSDRSLNFPECLRAPAAQKLLVSEFHAAALPALAALAPYHAYLEPATQQRIVRCLLKYGMVLRSPAPFINALTLFTLETRDTMVKMLPEVLLDLSKISDTAAIAPPMLEFLSTLTRLPRVFASFVEDQYMSVFAILLPYTNPSRYNHYVVSLAHHVIAGWFLKCRLPYRRNFVRFIIHGLHNYMIVPFEEQLQHRVHHAPANEDSSNRQRSSSLGSKAVPRAPLGRAGVASTAAGGAGGASSLATFHVELTETCLDLMARYSNTPCSVKPHRSDTAEFVFAGGQSMTWLVGYKLVTITTSGCQQNALKQGLCERCAALCRLHADSVAAPLPPLSPLAQDGEGAAHLQPPQLNRQNSSEKGNDPLVDILEQFSQRFERISKEVDGEEAGWSRVGELASTGACPCWCGGWAELHVRSPTGDVSWMMRVQNQMNWDYLLESPLQEVAALLQPLGGHAPSAPPSTGPSAPPSAAPSSASSGIGDSRPDVSSREEGAALHKSSSDSVVDRAPPPALAHRLSTQPINIPGSPQRQSSSSTTDDDDMLLIQPEGKSRHAVRRSNSSPEMSSSWKVTVRDDLPLDPDDMILLPSVEPSSTSMSLHASKKLAKKSDMRDMRVSCEAIPEEMCGTSPLPPPPAPAHPNLMTYNSDPGTAGAEGAEGASGAAGTAQHQLQKTASEGTVPAGAAGRERDELPPLARSKRSNTISVMSPTRRHNRVAGAAGGAACGAAGGGLSPAFVFLQLYHNMSTSPTTPPVPGEAAPLLSPAQERPLRVAGVQYERSIKNIDLVPPLETYKVGVLYAGPGQQDNEVLILKNECGSLRYCSFLSGLGTLVPLAGASEHRDLFLNVETGGRDGRYTYVWTDDMLQVLFHVATAMPSLPSDPTCNEKRKYIGNDFVSIVYNDSGADFNIHTIKGQFNLCVVVVEPLEHALSRVHVRTKDERIRAHFMPHLEPQTVSDANVALLARQLALHAALASQISQSLNMSNGQAFASNCLERLRLIKRLRRRVSAERGAAPPAAPYAPHHHHYHAYDFNDYT